MTGSMRYRLRVSVPTSDQMIKFARAMRAIQDISDNRRYNFIAGIHGAPSHYCWHHQFSRRSDVRAQVFLPWHRAYLHALDLALNDFSDDDIAQPWWDWTTLRDVPDSYSATQIDGRDNPLRRFRMNLGLPNGPLRRNTRRRPGRNPFVDLPTAREFENAIDDDDWSSFSDKLQGLHDDVHVWVGGDMGSTTAAAYDPIFYAHHAMVDRAWYLWQLKHGINNIPNALLDFVLEPFALNVRDVLDTRTLGYEYADQVIPVEPVSPVLVA